MRIGYFINHFPYPKLISQDHYQDVYAHGGTEIAAYKLGQQMVKKGHHVEVFTTAIGSKDLVENEDGMIINRYGTNLKLSSANLSYKILNDPLKHHLDLIHVHYNIPTPDLGGMRVAEKKGVPLVITYHNDAQETGGSVLRNSLHRIYNRIMLPRVLKRANIIITTSKAYIDQSPHLKPYIKKIRVIPNGINPKEMAINYSKEKCRSILNLPQNKIIILFFGNMVQYKGPDILLEAAEKLKNMDKDFLLVYAGRGPLVEKISLAAKTKGLNDQIRLVGFVEEEIKPIYYHAADIFCLPSVDLAEAFGIVNLEAMAAGLPIISSDLGGIPEIITHRVNGLLAPPSDIGILTDYLAYLIDNPHERRRMGENSLEMIKKFTWGSIAQQTEQLYQELLNPEGKI